MEIHQPAVTITLDQRPERQEPHSVRHAQVGSAPVDATRFLAKVQAIHAAEETASGSRINAQVDRFSHHGGSNTEVLASSSDPGLTSDTVNDMVTRVDTVAADAIAHRRPLRCFRQMVHIADVFKDLAAVAKSDSPFGDHAKAEGRKMLEKMRDSCWQITPPEQDWKPKHELRVQKAMVKLVIQYAHVFFDTPKEQAEVLSTVIKHAASIHASGTNRAYDAQGQIVRQLEKNLKHYSIETLMELAASITPQDIAAFSGEPPAGHTLVGHKTWRLGPVISVPNDEVERITKNYMMDPATTTPLGVVPTLLGNIPSFLARAADKAYQGVKNNLTDRLSGRDRMINLMLIDALGHPGMNADHLQTYFATILDTVNSQDATGAQAYTRAAHCAYFLLGKTDRNEIDSKREMP